MVKGYPEVGTERKRAKAWQKFNKLKCGFWAGRSPWVLDPFQWNNPSLSHPLRLSGPLVHMAAMTILNYPTPTFRDEFSEVEAGGYGDGKITHFRIGKLAALLGFSALVG